VLDEGYKSQGPADSNGGNYPCDDTWAKTASKELGFRANHIIINKAFRQGKHFFFEITPNSKELQKSLATYKCGTECKKNTDTRLRFTCSEAALTTLFGELQVVVWFKYYLKKG
jgi:hypothetical protein